MKERYSTKRGDAIPNPDLDPEIANHVELGHNAQISENLLIDASVFYSHVEDPIVIVHIGDSLEQEQNTGTEKYKGFETSIKYTTDLIKTGINYTYLNIDKDGDEVVLDVPTNDSMEITSQALSVLKRIYKDGFNYKKAGVIVGDIVSEESRQLSLFDTKNIFKTKDIMNAMDDINRKMGRNKIRLAVQGFDRKWRLKQEKLSPCYTTRFEDVLEVKI